MTGTISPAGPQARLLNHSQQLHLNHGPIDLVIDASGDRTEVTAAYHQAWSRFRTILDELVAELPALRLPATPMRHFKGAVPRRMQLAVSSHTQRHFVTPMAAVAGAVADETLRAMTDSRKLTRASVNNGGDIALHLAPGAAFDVGLVPDVAIPTIEGRTRITFDSPVRGIATSGWRGRSLSLGIADAVTVLAADAALADAAATLIANTVTVDSPAVRRRPACEIDLDSDLGDRPVVVDVGPLSQDEIDGALDNGMQTAEAMRRDGLIIASALCLESHWRLVGDAAARLAA